MYSCNLVTCFINFINLKMILLFRKYLINFYSNSYVIQCLKYNFNFTLENCKTKVRFLYLNQKIDYKNIKKTLNCCKTTFVVK